MVASALGKDALLKIGPAANNLTEITGAGNGLADYEITDEVANREIPGTGDAINRQSGERHDCTLTFTVDLNSVTLPLLWGRSGSLIYFEEGVKGSASGNPKRTGNGYLNVSAPVPTADAIVLSCTVECNGKITYSTYS